MIAHKTKATGGGRQWIHTKLERITNNATFAAGGQCDQCAGLLVGCQPLGSMPSLRSLSRQAFFTHELKLPGPATSLICCNNVSSKRMFFFVLPERSNFGFTFSSCIGTYHRYKLKSNGTYHIKNTQPLNTAKPGSAGTLTGLLTTNDRKRIEVAMLNHTTHPQGRDSHNLNKYIWRFIALSTAQPRVITIEATSEQEARQQSPAGCVMVFAARIRQGGAMPDMTNYQYLINPHFNCEHDIAKKVYSAADAATDNISMAVASIGNLMWYASENEDYDEKAMRIDMGNIGLLLAMLGHFDISLRCTIENATDALNAIKKANTDSNRG